MSLDVFSKKNATKATGSDLILFAPYGLGDTYFTCLFVMNNLQDRIAEEVFTAEDLLNDVDEEDVGFQFFRNAKTEIERLTDEKVLPIVKAGMDQSGEQLYRLK